MDKKKKITLITLACLAGIFLILQLSLPGILRSYVNNHGTELLGREVYLDDVSVNLIGGIVTMDSLTIYGQKPEEEPFIQLRQLKANLVMRHLLAGVIDLEYFNLDGLRLNIEQRDTVFNFSDILLRFSEEESSSADDSNTGLPLVLRDIAITNSYLHYQDLLVHSDFRINDISLRIPGVDLRDLNTNVGMDLTFFDGGNLSTQFSYDERRMTYAVDLHLTDFNMTGLLPYIQQYLWAEEFQGRLNGELHMRGNIQHVLDFQMTGKASVQDFALFDDDDHEVLTCDSLTIGVSEMNLIKNRIGLTHLVLHSPAIEITYDRDSIDNFTRMMSLAEAKRETIAEAEDSAPDPEQEPDSQPEFQLNIAQLQVREGHLFYHDLATNVEPFHYQVSDFSLNAPQFSLTGYNNAKGKALLGEGGSITLEYHGKLDDPQNMRFLLGASGIELNDFSPYTLQMFGNEVLNGTLSGNISADVHNGQLQGNIHFTAKDPQVSKRRKGINSEMNVPFRAGIYALTDKNGVCDIELPVSGRVDEPHFSYKRLIFRTLGKLFVKVSTTPFHHKNTAEGGHEDSLSTSFNAFDVEDIDIETFGNDSIGKALMNEEYE